MFYSKKNTNFVKLYKIMYKLTAIKYRLSLTKIVPNVSAYSDSQVFELMHAVNTNVDIKDMCNPNLSRQQMRQIRLNQEFGRDLLNNKNIVNEREVNNGEETTYIRRF